MFFSPIGFVPNQVCYFHIKYVILAVLGWALKKFDPICLNNIRTPLRRRNNYGDFQEYRDCVYDLDL